MHIKINPAKSAAAIASRVSGPDRRFCKRAFTRPRGRGAQELIAHTQRLIDTPRPPEGYSAGWCVEAKHLGDLNAIAISAIRADTDQPADPSHA